ncbi:hypothetical protein CJ030_MR5G023510 [Morella rubra]|uniref:Uncharacterized protein n=1 Tax=Morella rubra TaxID=262757 RepID=A0A6A1VL30_9ROSI|nr:hypothetical protein CJ030_MR5G023510 [Morella rubra]
MENKPDAKDIFHTFMGRDVVVSIPFLRQRYMLPFWRIIHLIFTYDIKARAHMTDCPMARGELMLYVARGGIVDFSLYIFLSLRSKVKISLATALPYSLLLTHFLHSVGCMDSPDEERKALIGPICRTTLSCFEA